MKGYKILLVEDDETLGYVLKEYLQMNDYQVSLGTNGKEGLTLFQQSPFDICVLDIMMPEMDGFTLAKEIKSIRTDIPILFLTAKNLKIDKLKGFQLGADDYVTKPVDEEELLARIQAILRRSQAKEKSQPVMTHFGNSFFDYKKRILTTIDQNHSLTDKEAELLKLLLNNKNNLLSREEALKSIWGRNDYFNRRSMDVHLSHLRKLLKADSSIKIVNVHGKGFILEDDSGS